MIRNFLVTTYRNILRNKFLSLLNIGGLSVGIASFLLIFQYVLWEKSYDTFHTHSTDIYRVSQLFLKNGALDFHAGATFPDVGPNMKDDFPEVLDYCRLLRKWRGGILSYDQKSFREDNLIYADPSFFNIFSYPLISGNPKEVLAKPHTAVIDQSTAIKYFGDENPIGKRIRLGSMDGPPEEYEITGVAQSLPNSHLAFDLLLSYSSAISVFGNGVEHSWGWWDFHTYILLDRQANINSLEERFPAFADRYGGERLGSKRVGFKLQPLEDIHLKSHIRHELGTNGNNEVVNFLLIISLFIIAIAWMNYINLTTAKAFNRAKEVGIRKTLGSKKWQLASQFLTEALAINLLSITFGLFIYALSLPYFSELIGKSIPNASFYDPQFWLLIITIWIGGSAISGFYPAWVLSSFDPKEALQSSNARHGHKASMRKALVIFQFIASTSLIAGTLVVYSQLDFMRSRDKGIVTKNVVTIPAPDVMDQEGVYLRSLSTYRDLLGNHSTVLSASLSSDIPGEEVSWMGSSRRIGGGQDEHPSTIIYKQTMDVDYLKIFENKFLSGRNFEKENDSIYVIINKAALEAFSFNSAAEALNQRISVTGVDTLSIIGVIDNFHQETLKEKFKPTVYLLLENERRHFSVKVTNANLNNFIKHAETAYYEVFSEGVFEYSLLDEHIKSQYQSEDTFLRTFLVFAGLAIVIALLGLTGLAFHTTQQRSKEISIRKILGSSTLGVFSLLSRDMLKNVLYANLLAFPLVVYYSNEWLNGFAFRQEFNYSLLVMALLLTLICSLLIISFHVIKAALLNPIIALRNE